MSIVCNGFSINNTLLCFLLAYLFAFVIRIQCTLQPNDGLIFEQFNEYVIRYNKAYMRNSSEFLNRFQIFKDNIERSKYMNKAYNNSHQAVYGINKFADLTQEEFKAQYLTGLKRNGCMRKQHFASAVTPKDLKSLGIPQKFDWREKGVLTGIRNQESCGACWSFSVVETMESMYAITYKSNFSTPELSVQQLIDCDYDNSGCKGGDICKAAVWAHLEIEMLKLLAQHGPIAVAVDATTWHNYIGGIIQFHCSSNINHAVQIVGYDLTGDVPYYIIRNSWGADFGDHGFIYIKYGENLCGLTVEVSHLNVTDYQ